jgi:hypothetical protein
MKYLRKPVYLILLLLLFMQSGGLFIVLKLQQYASKELMNEHISKSSTGARHLALGIIDFKSCITGRNEIFHDGKLFDILSVEFNSDSVHLIAINDVKEENILKTIKVLFTENSLDPKKSTEALLQLLFPDYLPTSLPDNTMAADPLPLEKFLYSESTILRNIEVFLPPPKMA